MDDNAINCLHDHVVNWRYFPRYWPFVRGFTGHQWIPPSKASDEELWCVLSSAPEKNGWLNNGEAGDLTHHRAHSDVTVMWYLLWFEREIVIDWFHQLQVCYPQPMNTIKLFTGPLFTKKTPSYVYRDPHDKSKTVWRPSQVYNGNPYTDKTASS